MACSCRPHAWHQSCWVPSSPALHCTRLLVGAMMRDVTSNFSKALAGQLFPSPGLLLEQLPQHTLGVSLGLLGAQERGGHPSTWQLAQRHDLQMPRGKLWPGLWQEGTETAPCDAIRSSLPAPPAQWWHRSHSRQRCVWLNQTSLTLVPATASLAPMQQARRERQRCFTYTSHHTSGTSAGSPGPRQRVVCEP